MRLFSSPPLKTTRASRTAMTLTEMAIVLLIAGSVLGGIWSAASGAWLNQRVNKTQQQMQTVVQNIRDYYARAQTPPTLTASVLTPASLMPSEMGAGPSYTHALGGAFVVSFPGGGVVRIQIKGLTSAACIKLLMAVPVDDQALGVAQVGTANMVTFKAAAVGSLPKFNLTTAVVMQWCNVAGTGNEADFHFKLRN